MTVCGRRGLRGRDGDCAPHHSRVAKGDADPEKGAACRIAGVKSGESWLGPTLGTVPKIMWEWAWQTWPSGVPHRPELQRARQPAQDWAGIRRRASTNTTRPHELGEPSGQICDHSGILVLPHVRHGRRVSLGKVCGWLHQQPGKLTRHRQAGEDHVRGTGVHQLWMAPPVWRVRGGPDPLLVQPPADLSRSAYEPECAQIAPESCSIPATSGNLGLEPCDVRVDNTRPGPAGSMGRKRLGAGIFAHGTPGQAQCPANRKRSHWALLAWMLCG